MPDNLSNKGPQDDSKINIHQEWEVDYWTKKLNCTRSQLIAAVKAVGVQVTSVRRHLAK